MDDIAKYEEAYTTPDIDIRIVRNTNSVERALQRTEMVRMHKIRSVNVNDMTFEGKLSPKFLSPKRNNPEVYSTCEWGKRVLPLQVQRSGASSSGKYIYIPSKMANIPTPIPQLKLNDGTSIPMLAYGSKSLTPLPR